jgi:hypothetical protein
VTAAPARWLGTLLVLFAVASCGKKGPPLAPLRPVPVAVTAWSAERDGVAVRLHVPVPDANIDGTKPPAVDRVDIYALTQPADAAAPSLTVLTAASNLVGTIVVRPSAPPKAAQKPNASPNATPTPDAPPDPRPAPGDLTTFVDPVASAADASVRYYTAVAGVGRRHGPASSILQVPLGELPASPEHVKLDYTEQKLTMSWQPVSDAAYVIAETDERGGSIVPLVPAPQSATTFEQPVAFDKNRCFTVRAAHVHGDVTVLGAPSAPACVTPRDHFPPPAPSGLRAAAADGSVDLVWSGVDAPDLGGYIVLRSAGANGTLRELTPAPISSSSYRDTTVQSGTSYVYAVVAVDKASPPNKSDLSNRFPVVARAPVARAPFER